MSYFTFKLEITFFLSKNITLKSGRTLGVFVSIKMGGGGVIILRDIRSNFF